MRRYSFFLAALSAVVTFIALSAFTGQRPWNREYRWRHGWSHDWRQGQRSDCEREGRPDNLRHPGQYPGGAANDSSTGPFRDADSTSQR